MKFIKACSFLCMVFIFSSSNAQHIKIIEGHLSALKDERNINTEFTYDHMGVGKFKDEAEYVAKKKEEYNEKEPGKGDKWAKDWVDDRHDKFEPKFNELLEKESGMTATDSKKDAKYTIIFNTNFTEPGFSAGWPVRKSAEIRGEAIIVETVNRSNVIAKISIEKAMGSPYAGFDFDTGGRIIAAYGKAGQALGKLIKKETE
jgi:hypothetical protein